MTSFEQEFCSHFNQGPSVVQVPIITKAGSESSSGDGGTILLVVGLVLLAGAAIVIIHHLNKEPKTYKFPDEKDN